MKVRFPLSFKISMGLGTLLIFFIVCQTVILVHVNNMNRQFSYIVENGEETVLNAIRFKTLIADMERDPGADKTFRAKMAQTKDLVSGDPGRQAALMRIEASVDRWQKERSAGTSTAADLAGIQKQISNFIADIVASNKDLYQNIARSVEHTKEMNYILLGLSIVISVVIVTTLLRGIFSSLFKLVMFSQRMKGGDLESRIEVTSADEFNILAKTFEEMRVKLKDSYAELRVSKDYLERILQSAGESIMITNTAGKIEYVNQAFEASTGFKRHEVIGKTPKIFRSGLQSQEFYRNMWGTISGGRTWFGNLINKKKDGSLCNVEETIAPIFDNNTIVSYVAILRDVTARRKMEEELKRTNRELMESHENLKQTQLQLLQSEKLASIGQLAAGVAHEINNPVGFISNNMELLGQYVSEYTKILRMVEGLKKSVTAGDMAAAQAIIQDIDRLEQEVQLDYVINETDSLLKHNQKGIERIQKIIMDLRTFARADNDTMELAKVEEIIDSILSIVYNELKYKAELKKDYGQTPLVRCNPQRIGQVFVNLFVNAAQAMDEKGTIGIKTYQQDGHLCVDVSDTGRGIPPENLNRIFDAFFTTKPIGQGTGLGLSVSYEIIKKHGGDIKVRSKVGEGTTFTVMLPTAQ